MDFQRNTYQARRKEGRRIKQAGRAQPERYSEHLRLANRQSRWPTLPQPNQSTTTLRFPATGALLRLLPLLPRGGYRPLRRRHRRINRANEQLGEGATVRLGLLGKEARHQRQRTGAHLRRAPGAAVEEALEGGAGREGYGGPRQRPRPWNRRLPSSNYTSSSCSATAAAPVLRHQIHTKLLSTLAVKYGATNGKNKASLRGNDQME